MLVRTSDFDVGASRNLIRITCDLQSIQSLPAQTLQLAVSSPDSYRAPVSKHRVDGALVRYAEALRTGPHPAHAIRTRQFK